MDGLTQQERKRIEKFIADWRKARPIRWLVSLQQRAAAATTVSYLIRRTNGLDCVTMKTLRNLC